MTETDDDTATDDALLRIGVALMVWHPSLDPAVLTAALAREPLRCWRAGEPRMSASGDSLPGIWPQSYWVADRTVEGRRDFFGAIGDEVAALEACAELLGRILAEGGEIHLKIELSGETNIGDVMPAPMLLRLGALGVGLAVEVFPDMA